MKKALHLVAVVALTSLSQLQAATDLVVLGSNGFTIDGGSVGTYAQSATSLTFTAAALSDSVYGYTVTTPVNLGAPPFAIRMTITGTNPDLPFTFEFYDSTYAGGPTGFSRYTGATTGLSTGTEVYAPLTLFSSGANLADIVGLGMSWGDSAGSFNVSMGAVASVPEPSTYALLAMSGLAFGGYVIRRRRRA